MRIDTNYNVPDYIVAPGPVGRFAVKWWNHHGYPGPWILSVIGCVVVPLVMSLAAWVIIDGGEDGVRGRGDKVWIPIVTLITLYFLGNIVSGLYAWRAIKSGGLGDNTNLAKMVNDYAGRSKADRKVLKPLYDTAVKHHNNVDAVDARHRKYFELTYMLDKRAFEAVSDADLAYADEMLALTRKHEATYG